MTIRTVELSTQNFNLHRWSEAVIVVIDDDNYAITMIEVTTLKDIELLAPRLEVVMKTDIIKTLMAFDHDFGKLITVTLNGITL